MIDIAQKVFIGIGLLLACSTYSHAQTDLSLETQIYPTGILLGISLDQSLSDRDILYGRVGLNLFDHRDLGVQEDESGSGYGFSLGYKRYLNTEQNKWRLGIKSDIWFNSVDWNTGTESGRTDIKVLQPTVELSYVFNLNSWILTPSIAAGYEWNMVTDGEPTGDGSILLIGVQVGRRL